MKLNEFPINLTEFPASLTLRFFFVNNSNFRKILMLISELKYTRLRFYI